MTIYEQLISNVIRGARYSIDLKTKTLKVNNTKLIDNGKYTGQLINFKKGTDVLNKIERSYNRFKHSVPSERSDKHQSVFKALSVDELDDIDMMFGMKRELAQAILEGMVLCSILSGDLKYPGKQGTWFYKSINEPELILLNSWFVNNK